MFKYKQNDDGFYFVKIFFGHFHSSTHDVIMLSIADISLIIRWIESQIGQRDLDSPYNFEVI